MKKFLLMIPFLMVAGCGSVQETTIQEDVQKEEKKSEIETFYMGDEQAGFSLETDSGYISVYPLMLTVEDELKSNNMFQDDAVAGEYSKFAVVGFLFLNESKESETFFSSDMLDIYDSEGRKYGSSSEYTNDFYLPSAVSLLEVRPGIPTKGFVVYEVAKDSTGFYMQAGDVKVILEEKEA